MNVLITGGTGYMGSRLIPLLLRRGHDVIAVVRPASEAKLPDECKRVVLADPLEMNSYAHAVSGCDTFVHLIGVPHPSPAKAKEFREIDLPSIEVGVAAARRGGIRHFVYLSVAQPASLMKDFIAVRARGEELLRESGMNATFLRPWYVLGPGHRWPYLLLPVYWLMACLPSTKESARRLGLVTIEQMLNALVWSVENPATGIRILDVPQIRSFGTTR
jgi:uncharacterized protein YbjT (DUF2867 family)